MRRFLQAHEKNRRARQDVHSLTLDWEMSRSTGRRQVDRQTDKQTYGRVCMQRHSEEKMSNIHKDNMLGLIQQ